MSVTIFADVLSQPSRALLIFCKVSGIEHEFKPVLIKNKENKTPEYTKINPFQTVPSAEVDGKPLVDSLTIMRYLVSTRKIDDHWYPTDHWKRAKVDEYLDWQHTNTRISCAMYTRHSWLIPATRQEAPNEDEVQRYRKMMETTLDKIEQIWLDGGSRRFIGSDGDKPTVADIWACCELEQPSLAGYKMSENHPVIDSYMNRVKECLNPHHDEVHSVLHGMVKKFGGRLPVVDDMNYNL